MDFEYLNAFGGSASKRILAKQVAEFCKKKLFPKTKNVMVDIKLVYGLTKNEGVAGDCFDEGDRTFLIRIDAGMKKDLFIETLCHEMVHVKQYSKGELYQLSSRPVHRWHREYIPLDIDYENRPWEIEAFELEEQLAKEFTNG